MKHDPERGTGLTTQQIKGAAHGALYVCKTHGFIIYAKGVAEKLGRGDLKFTSADKLDIFRGTSWPDVVFDHDYKPELKDYYFLWSLRSLGKAA